MGSMTSSGAALRPRYGRIAAFAAASSTTLVSLVGALVTGLADDPAGSRGVAGPTVSLAAASSALVTASSTGLRASLSVGMPDGAAASAPNPRSTTPGSTTTPPGSTTGGQEPALPPHSGTGRRVVFSESEQRVWLVEDDDEVARTYLVSGSVYDNLDPGTYEVYSHSVTATGVDGSELRWMVRFAQGDNAAIGFHWIPRMDGKPMQSRAELGTPLSHGCVRQATPDAKALWRFAPVGTTVVVTA
jgi:lipoprotein-anchoring transpeptidase ErfK/SrfK